MTAEHGHSPHRTAPRVAERCTYGLLCLNHDPAFPIGEQHDALEFDEIRAAVRERNLAGHGECDLLIGRYRDSRDAQEKVLLEVGCPGTGERAEPAAGCKHSQPHPHTVWMESDWLELLACAYLDKKVPQIMLDRFNRSCWTKIRVIRLAPRMGLYLGVRDEDE